MTDASASVHHSVQNATILTTGVLFTERQMQILSSAFPLWQLSWQTEQQV